MTRAKANGIEIEYETAGNKGDPALLLVMGLGAQLTIWPDAFFHGLAKRGFFVIRYDNRDTGLSTDFGSWGVPNIADAFQKVMSGKKVDAPYLLKDMAADAIGLLDALGIDKAHMVGASMGGMIVQIVAAHYPARTRSMVSIMSTSGRPGLPVGKPEALAMLTAQPEGPSREQRVKHGMKLRQTIARPGLSDAGGRAARLRREERRPPLVPGGRRPAVSVDHRLGRSRRAAQDHQGADARPARRGRPAAAGRLRPRRREPGAGREDRDACRLGPRFPGRHDSDADRSDCEVLRRQVMHGQIPSSRPEREAPSGETLLLR